MIDAAGGDERLGVCLDTQHLWASGIPFATVAEADDLVALIDATVGMARLRCMHLNDSKVDFGANRDRHENIGDGHHRRRRPGRPARRIRRSQGLPAILEVPGDGRRPPDRGRGRGPRGARGGPGPPGLSSAVPGPSGRSVICRRGPPHRPNARRAA